MGFPAFLAGSRHDGFESVHLPKIPADDVCKIFKNVGGDFFTGEFVFKMFQERDEQRFPGEQQIVALPFITVRRFVSLSRPLDPILFSLRIFAHNAEFPVQKSDAIFQRNEFSRGGVVAADRVRSFPARDFHPRI